MFIASLPEHRRSSVGAACFLIANLFQWLENIPLIEPNMVPLQKFNIFLLKRFSAIMRLLIVNVVGHAIEVRMGNRKCSEAFLP